MVIRFYRGCFKQSQLLNLPKMLLLVKGFLRQFNYSIHHLGMLSQLLHKTNKEGYFWNSMDLFGIKQQTEVRFKTCYFKPDVCNNNCLAPQGG